jgi:hypothetical protein
VSRGKSGTIIKEFKWVDEQCQSLLELLPRHIVVGKVVEQDSWWYPSSPFKEVLHPGFSQDREAAKKLLEITLFGNPKFKPNIPKGS